MEEFTKLDCGCYVGFDVYHKPMWGKKCSLHEASKDLYEALKAWDKLREMHPLDSGADIDEIFWECCAITDKALAKVEKK